MYIVVQSYPAGNTAKECSVIDVPEYGRGSSTTGELHELQTVSQGQSVSLGHSALLHATIVYHQTDVYCQHCCFGNLKEYNHVI